MRLLVLGPILVERRGRPVLLPSGRRRAILAALAMHHGRVVPFARLVDMVWGEHPPRAARETLHSHVSRLREVLDVDEPRLVTGSGGYLLDLREGDELDVLSFERLARRARDLVAGIEAQTPAADGAATARVTGTAEEALAVAQEALSVWRGPAYGELGADEPFRSEAVRLEELRTSTAEARVAALLSLGRPAEVIGELRAAVAAHPLRERPVGQLMRALAASGRRAGKAMTEQNKQVLRDLWRAVADRDLDAIGRCHHPDVTYHAGTDYRGRDAVLEYFSAYLGAFPDLHGEVRQILAEGDLVAHRARVTGTHKGEFLGAPATGNRVDVHGIILSRMVDGVIIEDWEGFDQLKIIKQLGLA